MEPSDDYGAVLKASYGDFGYHRVIGILQSGKFTSFGTKLLGSISVARNNKFKGPGEISKQQYNLRVYQPLGGKDFISIAGHFNRNRNNFYRNLTIPQVAADYANDGKLQYDNNQFCARPTGNAATPQNEGNTSQPSTAVPTNLVTLTGLDTSCTNYYGVRINPSDTGNVRINAKFTLSDKLTLTVDPSFQYVLANGGGFTTLAETDPRARGSVPGQFQRRRHLWKFW
jgi:iron complex outermembrane recepter protein